jgi:hypothetical protein
MRNTTTRWLTIYQEAVKITYPCCSYIINETQQLPFIYLAGDNSESFTDRLKSSLTNQPLVET